MSNSRLEYQRQHRKATGNASTRKYEKTVNGFLMRVYRNMTSRVTGVQKKKAHLYLGLPILPKVDFYEWSKTNLNFVKLFKEWETLGYDQCYTPSIDRIDSSEGYLLHNMRWLTHSENSRLATGARHAA